LCEARRALLEQLQIAGSTTRGASRTRSVEPSVMIVSPRRCLCWPKKTAAIGRTDRRRED